MLANKFCLQLILLTFSPSQQSQSQSEWSRRSGNPNQYLQYQPRALHYIKLQIRINKSNEGFSCDTLNAGGPSIPSSPEASTSHLKLLLTTQSNSYLVVTCARQWTFVPRVAYMSPLTWRLYPSPWGLPGTPRAWRPRWRSEGRHEGTVRVGGREWRTVQGWEGDIH